MTKRQPTAPRNFEDFPGRTARHSGELAPYVTPILSLMPPVAMGTESAGSRRESFDVVEFLKDFIDSRRKQNRSFPQLGQVQPRENFLRSHVRLTIGEEALNRGRKNNGLPEAFHQSPVSVRPVNPVHIASSDEDTRGGKTRREKPNARARIRVARSTNNVIKRGKSRTTGARNSCPAVIPNLVLRPWDGEVDEGSFGSGALVGSAARVFETEAVLYPPHHGL